MTSRFILLILACLSILFAGCGGDGDCDISDITVETGECNCEEDYSLILNFNHSYDGDDFFQILLRANEHFGYFKFEDLPLTLDKFPLSGNTDDFIKICIVDDPACCAEFEWTPLDCSETCSVSDIEVRVGECNSDETYTLGLDFNHEHANNEFFDLFVRNDELIGFYELADLPLRIEDFPFSGEDYDFLKICINDNPDCCEEIEFMPPSCEDEECRIFDLEIEVGECTSEDTYDLFVDFEYTSSETYFVVYVDNNVSLGRFPLADLPIKIEDFKKRNSIYDYIKVCIGSERDCCAELEWVSPECEEGDCKIFDLEVDTGDCINSEVYELNINFEYINPTHTRFEVFVRNDLRIGNYALSELPLTIEEFEKSGNDHDLIKVCMSDNPDCCEVIEFRPPACTGECEIYDVVIEPGRCISDSTYVLELDFKVDNPGNELFELWVRDNVYLGFYRIDELPLRLDDFRLSGEDYDFLRICINDVPDCCREEEWMAPDC